MVSLFRVTMEITCVALLLFMSLFCINSQDVNGEIKCNEVWYCCDKVDLECNKYCGPIVECAKALEETTTAPEETTEVPDFFDSTTTETQGCYIPFPYVCRKGYKKDPVTDKCKKVF